MFRNLLTFSLFFLTLTACAVIEPIKQADSTPLVQHAQAVTNEVFISGNIKPLLLTPLEQETLPSPNDLPIASSIDPVVSVLQKMTPWEHQGIKAALEIAELKTEEIPQHAISISSEEFANVNLQNKAIAGNDSETGLNADLHAYALGLPLLSSPVQWQGSTFYPTLIFSVPRNSDPDKEDSKVELLRTLLAFLVIIPAQDAPVAVPPPKKCNPPVPDTAASIADALDRLNPDKLHKNHPNPKSKQGQWFHDPQNNRVARGQMLSFYKSQLGVGCDNPTSWGVGLEFFDLQFRIVLGPGAQKRPPADNGQTPGGLEGTLAHEAEHGETMAEAFRAALNGQRWNGIPWGIKSVLDDMASKRYKTKAKAIKAKRKFQKRLDKAIEILINASGALHSGASEAPGANSAPRDGTPEPLDHPDQQKVTDQKKKKDGIKEMKDLTKKHGYKSYVKPGLFGKYP